MPKTKPKVKAPVSARLLKNRPPESEEEAEKMALGEPIDFAPKQRRLPEMDDPVIEELEEAAERYVAIRDKRMALTEQEVDQKNLLLTLLKRHKKEHYRRDGIEITRVLEKEKVKVVIKKEEE